MQYCAFELHPGIAPEGTPVPWDPATRAQRHSQFAEAAAAEGLEVGERTHWYSSLAAHEAAEWATARGAGDAFRWAVFRAYFVHNHNISSTDVLAGIAESLSLDVPDLRQALDEGRHRAEVAAQLELCQRIGVTAVPTFVAERHALVGAHPIENLRRLISTAAEHPVDSPVDG